MNIQYVSPVVNVTYQIVRYNGIFGQFFYADRDFANWQHPKICLLEPTYTVTPKKKKSFAYFGQVIERR